MSGYSRNPHRSYRSRSHSASPSRHHQSISASRSPIPASSHRRRDNDRTTRSRSPERRSKHESSRRRHDHRHNSTNRSRSGPPVSLPFGAAALSKRDLERFEPVLGLYLDIQKGIYLEDLSERELKGRWKSFVGKWNRGELAEGWYDPATLDKARSSYVGGPQGPESATTRRPRDSPEYGDDRRITGRYERPESALSNKEQEADEEEEEESYGPQLPPGELAEYDTTHQRSGRNIKSGPAIPNTQDLQLKRETEKSDLQSLRTDERALHKHSVKSHKSQLRTFEDEVAPRAEPGTHERRLEKKRQAAASNRAFAESRRGGSPGEAVPDAELMGGGDGGDDLEALKRERERDQRKKNERELRKEEMLRARAAEREERVRNYQQREEETMSVLRALAKQRFG